MTDETDETDDLAGTYTAVVDRYEGERAVLVIGDGDRDIAERLVERAILPAAGRAVDSVLEVRFDDTTTEIIARPDETAERAERAQSRFDRLSRRRRSSDDADG